MELGQSHDQPDEDVEDEPPAKKMRYGDAEIDAGRDHRTILLSCREAMVDY